MWIPSKVYPATTVVIQSSKFRTWGIPQKTWKDPISQSV